MGVHHASKLETWEPPSSSIPVNQFLLSPPLDYPSNRLFAYSEGPVFLQLINLSPPSYLPHYWIFIFLKYWANHFIPLFKISLWHHNMFGRNANMLAWYGGFFWDRCFPPLPSPSSSPQLGVLVQSCPVTYLPGVLRTNYVLLSYFSAFWTFFFPLLGLRPPMPTHMYRNPHPFPPCQGESILSFRTPFRPPSPGKHSLMSSLPRLGFVPFWLPPCSHSILCFSLPWQVFPCGVIA